MKAVYYEAWGRLDLFLHNDFHSFPILRTICYTLVSISIFSNFLKSIYSFVELKYFNCWSYIFSFYVLNTCFIVCRSRLILPWISERMCTVFSGWYNGVILITKEKSVGAIFEKWSEKWRKIIWEIVFKLGILVKDVHNI